MRPGLPHLLVGAATAIGTRILPALDPRSYAAGDAKMLAAMLIIMAQDVGRAADRLARENRVMRALFADAADAPLGVALAGKLSQAAASSDDSLVVDDLEREHDRLSTILIELHEAVEQSAADWAVALDARIWAHLRNAADARAVVLPVIG